LRGKFPAKATVRQYGRNQQARHNKAGCSDIHGTPSGLKHGMRFPSLLHLSEHVEKQENAHPENEGDRGQGQDSNPCAEQFIQDGHDLAPGR
jgi:hypothetical protein